MTLAHPEWLVGTDWLEANLGDPGLRIFDVTAKLSIDDSPDTCRDDYEAAHVPGYFVFPRPTGERRCSAPAGSVSISWRVRSSRSGYPPIQ